VSAAPLGRGLVVVGIVTGLLAVALPFAGNARYVDDGTIAGFLIVLLSLTSLLPSETGRDLPAACAGSAAFGFFLFVPTVYAFDGFGQLEAGAWLGLCTALIPIGALLVLAAEGLDVAIPRGPGLLVGTAGLVLVAVGIPLDFVHPFGTGTTYWNLSSSGHAIGLLLIALILANAVLITAAAHSRMPLAGAAMLVASMTFGFTAFAFISFAFGDFDALGAGAWIEAAGGMLLLGGIVLPRLVHSRDAEPAAKAA
jgi:hypothetical protein